MLQVGQVLYYVPAERRFGKPYDVKVTKIGRNWAELEGGQGRVDVKTLWLDGGQYASPGRCWLSREAYELHVLRQTVWRKLRLRLTNEFTVPEGVTVEQIEQAAALLGLAEVKP